MQAFCFLNLYYMFGYFCDYFVALLLRYNSCGMRDTASCFFSSSSLAYICVVDISLWPKSLLTV